MRSRTILNATLAMAATIALGAIFKWSDVGRAARSTERAAGLASGSLLPTLHQINQMEIEAGNMARAKGSNQAIKDYGSTLERDHQSADDRLKDYAHTIRAAINGPVPERVQHDLYKAKLAMDKLRSKNGSEFDRAFAKAMKKDHEAAIAIVDRSRPQITDAKLKTLLDDLEPTLRADQQIASNILADINANQSPAGNLHTAL